MAISKFILHNCLYFTANSLARIITRMAEEEFRFTGVSPSHAFLMILVNENPGIGQKELCKQLNLAPSTITRFIDTLVYKGYLSRKNEGKISEIYPTDEGKKLQKLIEDGWKSLHQRYSKVLGVKEGDNLAHMIDETNCKLSPSTI